MRLLTVSGPSLVFFPQKVRSKSVEKDMSKYSKKPEVAKKSDTSKAKVALRSVGHDASVDTQGGEEP